MPAPKDMKEIKQLLDLTGYYRKFVPRFAAISRLLTTLMKKEFELSLSGLQHARDHSTY